jgi:hypothetical protein
MVAFESTKIEDCVGGGMIFKYKISEKIDEKFIFKLKEIGQLEYYGHFPRPFFRVSTKDGTQLKGIEGENEFIIIFTISSLSVWKKVFECFLIEIE